MQITLEYQTQLKRVAGTGSESLQVAEGTSLVDLLSLAGESRDESFRQMILTPAGELQPALLLFRGDQQVSALQSFQLTDGDVITLVSPISGG